MSLVADRKRRLSSDDSSEEDDLWQSATRPRLLPSSASGTTTTTQTVPYPHPASLAAQLFGAVSASRNANPAPTLPRIPHAAMPTFPAPSFAPPSFPAYLPPLPPHQPPPPPQPQSSPVMGSPVSAFANPANYFPPPLLPSRASLPQRPSARAASSDVILVDDDDEVMDGDADLARAIAASLAESHRRPTAPLPRSSAVPYAPPSPSNSVISLDADEDECRVVDSFISSSWSPRMSSSSYLPLSPSRWASLPVDLLALISTFQFGGGRPAGDRHSDDDDPYGPGGRLYSGAHYAGLMGQQLHGASEERCRPDDAVLSIRLILSMSVVCRRWHAAVRPPVGHRVLLGGSRVVDCWAGVQQLEIKQSGKLIHVGGIRVKRKHIATVLASLNCLRAITLDFNTDPSAFDDTDFELLLAGGTMTGAFPQLQHLTIRLRQVYVPPRPSKSRKSHHHARHSGSSQQTPQQVLYSKLSPWLDCHPKLRSFALIDPLATVPMPHMPFFPAMMPPIPLPQQLPVLPQPPVMRMQARGRRRRVLARRAAVPPPQPQPAPLVPPPVPQPALPPQAAAFPAGFPFGLGLGQLAGMVAARLQRPTYRPPAVPQPTVAALRLLCTGRLQHLALGGETVVRLAHGEEEGDEKEEKEGKEGGEGGGGCFRVDEVQSITLVGNYAQPRYVDALYEALPSLTHLTLSRSQTSAGVDQLLAKLGPRIAFMRGHISSLVGLAQPATLANWSALQSLYIHTYHQAAELPIVYAAVKSLPSLTQLSVVEERGSQLYPVLHNLPELLLPPLPNLLYLHLQLASYRVFPLVANRTAQPSTILPAKLTHLLLSIPGQQLVPHLSSVPLLCPQLKICHINSGASVTSQTWEARLGRLKGRLGKVWCESAGEVMRHRMDVVCRAGAGVRAGSGSGGDEWEGEMW